MAGRGGLSHRLWLTWPRIRLTPGAATFARWCWKMCCVRRCNGSILLVPPQAREDAVRQVLNSTPRPSYRPTAPSIACW